MLCKHAKKTGKPCSDGYSKEIGCPYSKTACLRDCGPGCGHYEPASAYNGGSYVDYTKTSGRRAGGCCGG